MLAGHLNYSLRGDLVADSPSFVSSGGDPEVSTELVTAGPIIFWTG